ncbi:LysR family transcriptional regulator [Pseudaestuariivita atlantica]|uniref:HTH lysR-type domain-containing protein n=1 Tax=Pseudaestuariivita atlantica TaxID=1317121 RepID=A0A0L1JS83_9RHOB|nr:LysR family transcriptional regulator [Pseudaestuariivita atlantica]KNG94557.1 hypothetical protein ATO11_03870 [Pseudaestuariivita atlantica]
MIDLKDLQCLVTLVQQEHFARAAKKCALSQPAFSMRIRNLEDQLGARIVKRGNRYHGLTAEGELVLDHARAILDRVRTLEEGVRAARGEVVGDLVLGVIPSAAPFAGRVASRLHRQYPGIRLRLETATSFAVQQGVDDGQLDAGFTYVEGTPADIHQIEAVYDEEYALLVGDALAPEGATATWEAAAGLPLVLLNRDMQNRRILDTIFREAGVAPTVIAETAGFSAAMAMVMDGAGATVLPRLFIENLSLRPGVRILPLVDPEIRKPVALIVSRRAQALPVIDALRRAVADQ